MRINCFYLKIIYHSKFSIDLIIILYLINIILNYFYYNYYQQIPWSNKHKHNQLKRLIISLKIRGLES